MQNIGTPAVAPPQDIPLTAVDSAGPEPLTAEIEELGRVELPVGAVAGYLLVNGEKRELPIGSTLKDGVFYWQLGPGFLGDYDLVLIRPGGKQLQVRINVRPKPTVRLNETRTTPTQR